MMLDRKAFKSQIIKLLLYPILFSLILVSCSSSIRSEINAVQTKVSQLSVSRGYDLKNSVPFEITDIFSATDNRIFVSSYLEPNQEIQLDILWFHEDKLVKTQDGVHTTGWVFTWVEPGGTREFKPGNYRVEVRWLEMILAETEFVVEKPTP